MGFLSNRSTSQQTPRAHGLTIQTAVQGRPLPIVYGVNRLPGNLLWHGDFFSGNAPGFGKGGGGKSGGGKGKGKGGPATPNYSTSVAIGLCEGPISSIGFVWGTKSNYPNPAAAGFGVFLGDYSQSPWAYLTSNHPGQDLNYRGIAYVTQANLQLGSSPALPQYSWEVRSTFQYGGGIVDANPSDIITDLATNVNYGASPVIPLGSMTQYSNYCVATGIFLSEVLDTQETFGSALQRILQLTNSTCVWSAPGVLTILPYGDKTVTGNSVTYTPQLTPQYDLDDESFIISGATPPVLCDRTSPADAYNELRLECVNRGFQYNPAHVEWKDQAAIDRYGLRPSPSVIMAPGITSPAVGAIVVQLIGRRGLFVRNTYSFKLPLRFSRLEAGDLVTLTDARLGLNRQLVRLTEVIYGGTTDELIDCKAEEIPVGTAAPAAYGSVATGGDAPDYNASPGPVNTPVIFDGPGILTNAGYEIWAAAAGTGANWGGCQVWVSSDNATYRQVGALFGPSRYGVLSGSFASGLDPDTVNTCPVDLTTSKGSLTSGIQADADQHTTLALVGSELIAYQTATLTAQYKYNLTAYLRRGIFGTAIVAHATNDRFVRLDALLARVPYDPSLVGSTLYFKFPSFNQWGGAGESLASVPAYTYTVLGPLGAPDNVKNFSVSQNGILAVFQWDLLPAKNISGYEIRYNPLSVPDPLNWGSASLLTQVTKGTQITTAKLPPGSWMCLIKAVDLSQRYSVLASSATITMTNTNVVIAAKPQAPDWWGPAVGYFRHASGVLIPESTKLANQLTNAQLFQSFVPFPVATSTYDAPEIDLLFDGAVRLHGDVVSRLGPGVSSGVASPTLYEDSRLSAGIYAGFQAWTIGVVTCRYFKMRIVELAVAVGNAVVSAFTPTADAPSTPVTMTSVVIGAGGTTVTFPQQYHLTPNVQVSMIAGTTSLTPVITSITTTSCVINVYNASNTSVGGTVDITITGA